MLREKVVFSLFLSCAFFFLRALLLRRQPLLLEWPLDFELKSSDRDASFLLRLWYSTASETCQFIVTSGSSTPAAAAF